eukprot:gene5810-6051_t
MPELWRGGDQAIGHNNSNQYLQSSGDQQQLRDQGMPQIGGQQAAGQGLSGNFSVQLQQHSQSERSSWQQQTELADFHSSNNPGYKQDQGQPAVPLELVLGPLLPSADEAKLTERLSQLRAHLDEQRHLAAFWEQQAAALQQDLADSQQDALTAKGKLVATQQHVALLGGNLQGRLSQVQGSVLAQVQAQVSDKDAALSAGQQQLIAIQVEELQGLLAEKQLQIEWLEGKVADLEGSDLHSQ